MARTILVAAVTALAVAFGFQALTKPIQTPLAAADPADSNDGEILRRLRGIEERIDQLSLRADRAPPRLEGRPEIPVSRIEAMEARIAEIAEYTEQAQTEADAEKAAARAASKQDAEVDRWIKALHDKSESVAFSATVELARLKDRRAADPLIAVLRHHRDYYVRLGAAHALGEIKALEGVPYLIDALGDKDALVRTAASEALLGITDGRIEFSMEFDAEARTKAQEAWRLYWLENETRLRAN